MRFGLVGTGPWATGVHGPGLRGTDGVDLVGVWGRSPEKAAALADELGVRSFADYDALLSEVEAVAFAVPPDVQAGMALAAARAGKHLLLDKPVALTSTDAGALADEVDAGGLASVVFFTDRFSAHPRGWFDEVVRAGGWLGAWSRWLAALDAPGAPSPASPWRRRHGALWDVGPHALSTLTAVLGPIASVAAVGGRQDLVHLVLTHEDGATSTATLTLFAPAGAATSEVTLWGEHGLSTMPSSGGASAQEAYVRAATELVAAAGAGSSHPVDVRLGAHVVALLVSAQEQLDRPPGRRVPV